MYDKSHPSHSLPTRMLIYESCLAQIPQSSGLSLQLLLFVEKLTFKEYKLCVMCRVFDLQLLGVDSSINRSVISAPLLP